jgi:hypothetical protein
MSIASPKYACCGEQSLWGYVCELPLGHSGAHEAEGCDGIRIAWPNDSKNNHEVNTSAALSDSSKNEPRAGIAKADDFKKEVA